MRIATAVTIDAPERFITHLVPDAKVAGALLPRPVTAGGDCRYCSIIDPDARWAVAPGALRSQGKHTPFAFERGGMELPGRVRATLVAGTVAFAAP